MARYNPHRDVEPVVAAAALWRERCLAADGSVLFPTLAVWTLPNIVSLHRAFTENPDEGSDTFLVKLSGQLRGQSREVILLAAEVVWLLQLFPSNTGAEKKRENVMEVLSWTASDLLPDPTQLSDSVLCGIGSAGTAFNTQRWREFAYLLSIARAAKSAGETERGKFLIDPWSFATFLKSVPEDGARQFSHILEFLLFPDTFERISSGEEKRKIIVALGNESADAVKQLDREGRDRRLLQLRQRLAAERGSPDFDFYDDDLAALWRDGSAPAPADGATISADDIKLFQQSRRHAKYAQLSPDEAAAYRRIHAALGRLGAIVSGELGEGYTCRLTSGYTPQSGVRGALPKDLWFGVYADENEDAFVGHPQIYMIASERGLEYGFAAVTHPNDFSNSEVKARVRSAASSIFRMLPAPNSSEAEALAARLEQTGGWTYRRKERLPPHETDYPDLSAWLDQLHEMTNFHSAGGNVSRFLVADEIDRADLDEEVRQTAGLFRSLMERTRAGGAVMTGSAGHRRDRDRRDFATIATAALQQFREARTRPFTTVPELWSSMDELLVWFGDTSAMNSRPHIFGKWSLGRGNWASVPWLALMNRNVTTSTQHGLYVVLLVAEDLSRIYLTLNQGMTKLVAEHGEQAAVRLLKERAVRYRQQVEALAACGFTLGDGIDLKTTNWRASNYQPSTIAFVEFDTSKLPADEQLAAYLEPLLEAYDTLVQLDNEEATPVVDDEPAAEAAPYSVDDAMESVFLDRDEFERILSVWRTKKNLVLQGAPGVGKSFVARHLAYALMERRDDLRIENIQFHQAYSYEDFIQGYRPTEHGGFELRDGVFHRFCRRASLDLKRPYVFIIDEINRGNLSKIFGELMLLIEPDKRSPQWGTQLAYAKDGDAKFHVPPNVHVIGMMNTADRSLSMVDYALRRRFAFVTLSPAFASPKFQEFLLEKSVPKEYVDRICYRMQVLNRAIGEDVLNLGLGYRIGHSFFVPSSSVSEPRAWYRQIVDTEIMPLLEEYWFDAADKAKSWGETLLDGA